MRREEGKAVKLPREARNRRGRTGKNAESAATAAATEGVLPTTPKVCDAIAAGREIRPLPAVCTVAVPTLVPLLSFSVTHYLVHAQASLKKRAYCSLLLKKAMVGPLRLA